MHNQPKHADKRTNETTKAFVMLALNLFASIIAGFLPEWTDKVFNTTGTWKSSEQILLGTSVFAALTLVEVLWLLSRDLEEKHAAFQISHLDSAADMMLHNIRASYHELAVRSRRGTKDFFVAYFTDALMALETRIRDAAKKGAVSCEGEHVNLKESLEETLLSSATRNLKYTWHIGPSDPLFDFYPWHSYFKTTCELAAAKRIQKMEVLLVFETNGVVERADVKKLIEIYSKIPNCDCYCLDLRRYKQVVDSVRPQEHCIDFGMYGENLLYLGLDYSATQHKSIFTSDAKTLHDYQKIWHRCLDDAEKVPDAEKFQGERLDLNPLFSISQKAQP